VNYEAVSRAHNLGVASQIKRRWSFPALEAPHLRWIVGRMGEPGAAPPEAHSVCRVTLHLVLHGRLVGSM
jgi:hypothetical protein